VGADELGNRHDRPGSVSPPMAMFSRTEPVKS
jgi:hypothetical protein